VNKITFFVLGGGFFLGWWLWENPQHPAKPAPPKVTVIHQTVTRVVHDAAPSLAPGVEHTVIAVTAIVLAFGVLCAVLMRRA
jgi:hypothetical protein